jgi:hypothetical protein
MNIAGQRSNVGTDLRFWCGAPGRIRTRDPLLRRYRWSVAGRRLTLLYKPSSSGFCRCPSEGVARRLALLAHLLAHQNSVAFANVRTIENIVDYAMVRRVGREPSHQFGNAVSSMTAGRRALSGSVRHHLATAS